MTPRVMAIIAARDVSGPAKNLFRLVEELRGQVSFHVYNFAGPGPGERDTPFHREAERRGVEVSLLARAEGPLGARRRAARDARRLGVDIVQTHGFKPTTFGLYAKYAAPVKWICFLHGRTTENLKVRLYHGIDLVAQRFADRTVIVCDAQRAEVPGGDDRRRVRVVYNGVDPDEPAPRSAAPPSWRARLGLAPETLLLAVIGRLSPEKGVDVFLEALARVPPVVGGRPVHGLLLGEGQERAALERRAAGLGVAARVHFAGSSPTPGDAIEQADLVVIPSRSEACPNVLLESMALGTPVVATRVGGVPELCRDGDEALLVPRGDAAALAAAIERALAGPALAQRLAQRARARVGAAFTPAARARAVLEIYDELLGVRHAAARVA